MPKRRAALLRPPAPGPLAAATAVVGAVAALCGCTEPPAYEVRWKLVDEAALADPDAAPELESVKQCADVGVSKVRVTTRRANQSIADVREYPCFPSVFADGGAVEVPALPAGEYTVEVEGLRRTGQPWICEDDPNTPEVDACVAFAEASVTVAEGSLPTVEVALLQPPECDDGIDNDRDGRVDGRDPACLIDPDGPESAEASVTLFQLSVSFLDSEAVEPDNVRVDAIELRVDGELFAEVTAAELDTSQWPFRLPLLADRFDPGSHLLTVTAVDGQGQARTSAFEVEFTVSDDSAGFVFETFAFTSDEFLEPIVEPFAVAVGLLLDPDDAAGSTCSLGGFLGGAPVTVDRTWLRVTDDQGQPLDAATLQLATAVGGSALDAVDEGGGWVSFPCPSAAFRSAELGWGSYAAELEARIGDAVCFTRETLVPLAPLGDGFADVINLDRVVDDQGAPPAGCEECAVDSDCSGQICDAGICKDKQP